MGRIAEDHRATGQKATFTESQVAMLREKLAGQHKWRDLLLLEVALSTFLRSSDILTMRVKDLVRPDGSVKDVLDVQQKKTGDITTVMISVRAKSALDKLILDEAKRSEDYIFTRKHRPHSGCLTHQAYLDIVQTWAKEMGLVAKDYGTHSLRRTAATHLYNKTGNLKAVSKLLGHTSLKNTQIYLAVDMKQALRLLEENQI